MQLTPLDLKCAVQSPPVCTEQPSGTSPHPPPLQLPPDPVLTDRPGVSPCREATSATTVSHSDALAGLGNPSQVVTPEAASRHWGGAEGGAVGGSMGGDGGW